jgi:hypothetical protein
MVTLDAEPRPGAFAHGAGTDQEWTPMTDPRCCGTESCIIDAEGVCWCGQKWDGEKMCFPPTEAPAPRDVRIAPDDDPGA